VFFYELLEGEGEMASSVLVVSESEWEPEEFLELVQRIRRDVQDTFEQDSLTEAIADVLERDFGFAFPDRHLSAAVNVSTEEADNFLVELESDIVDMDDDDDDDDDDDEDEPDYRSVLVDFEPGAGRLN